MYFQRNELSKILSMKSSCFVYPILPSGMNCFCKQKLIYAYKYLANNMHYLASINVVLSVPGSESKAELRPWK